nr:mytilus inhibitory peptide 1 [Ambigolimax valentianus]
MVECVKYGAAILALVAGLTLVVTEDMQNAGAASFRAENADTLWDTPKQQTLQAQQQTLGLQHSRLAAELNALLADQIDSSSAYPRATPGLASPVGLFAGASGGEHFRFKKSEAADPFLVGDELAKPDLLMGVYPPLDDETILLHSNVPALTPYLSAREFKETFRRSNPYFLGKRARYVSPDDMLLEEDKRKAPIFVGRRGPQDTDEEIDDRSENDLADFASEDSGGLLGEDRMDTTKLLERNNVNGSFMHPDKSAHTSIGLIIKAMELENVMGLTFEQKRRAPKFVGRRRAPTFVGKRRSPKFIGKRLAGVIYPDEDLNHFEEKRRSPKFVGKRVFSYLFDKRGAPRFVGRRGAPRFVGKRGAPRFVGKRVQEWEDDSVSEKKRRAPKFVGRRASAPYFVGKRHENSVAEKYSGTFDGDIMRRHL